MKKKKQNKKNYHKQTNRKTLDSQTECEKILFSIF